VIIRPITLRAAHYVAANMRAADAREIFATRHDNDRARLAEGAAALAPCAYVAGEGEPIACIGATEMWPGVWQAWMFATDRFADIGLPLTRWVIRDMIPGLIRAGAHRAHCYSIEGHDRAHRWLEALGFVHEATHQGYGRNGEAFRVYARGVG